MQRTAELRRSRPMLGTLVEITAQRSDGGDLAGALTAAFTSIAKVQRLMSFHDGASDVSRLNRLAARVALRVHPWTFAVLREAQRTAEASAGVFDITVAAHLTRTGHLPRPRGIPVPHRRACWRDIQLLPGKRVRFLRPLMLDLGGIAKGFAVDRAIACLRAQGVEAALVNAGGDLRCFGSQPQRVHVRDPRRPGILLPLAELTSAAIATSAAYFSITGCRDARASALVHRRRPHFVPRGSASAVAARCVVADAWTKVLLLGGRRFLGRAKRAGVSGMLIDAASPRRD